MGVQSSGSDLLRAKEHNNEKYNNEKNNIEKNSWACMRYGHNKSSVSRIKLKKQLV